MLPLFFKYVFKSLAGVCLRYKFFLVLKMIMLRCRILAKLITYIYKIYMHDFMMLEKVNVK